MDTFSYNGNVSLPAKSRKYYSSSSHPEQNEDEKKDITLSFAPGGPPALNVSANKFIDSNGNSVYLTESFNSVSSGESELIVAVPVDRLPWLPSRPRNSPGSFESAGEAFVQKSRKAADKCAEDRLAYWKETLAKLREKHGERKKDPDMTELKSGTRDAQDHLARWKNEIVRCTGELEARQKDPELSGLQAEIEEAENLLSEYKKKLAKNPDSEVLETWVASAKSDLDKLRDKYASTPGVEELTSSIDKAKSQVSFWEKELAARQEKLAEEPTLEELESSIAEAEFEVDNDGFVKNTLDSADGYWNKVYKAKPFSSCSPFSFVKPVSFSLTFPRIYTNVSWELYKDSYSNIYYTVKNDNVSSKAQTWDCSMKVFESRETFDGNFLFLKNEGDPADSVDSGKIPFSANIVSKGAGVTIPFKGYALTWADAKAGKTSEKWSGLQLDPDKHKNSSVYMVFAGDSSLYVPLLEKLHDAALSACGKYFEARPVEPPSSGNSGNSASLSATITSSFSKPIVTVDVEITP